MKLHLLLLTIATLTSNLGHAALPGMIVGNDESDYAKVITHNNLLRRPATTDRQSNPAAINYAEAKKQENEKLLALKLAQNENKEATAIRQENGILTTLGLPKVLQQLINEYCYSPLEFFQYIYEQLTIRSDDKYIRALAVAPDGKTIVSGSLDATIKIWDIGTQKCIATLHGHTAQVLALAFSTDNKTIISSSDDSIIKMWDTATQNCIATLPGYTDSSWAIAISTDTKTIAFSAFDNSITIWNIATHRCIATLPKQTDTIRTIALSTDGKTITLTPYHGSITTWDIATQKCIGTLAKQTAFVKAITLSTDGKTIVSADGTTEVWDIATQNCIATLPEQTGIVRAIALSTDGRTIVFSFRDLHDNETINIHECKRLLNSLMQLPYEQLVCLKLIINLLNNIEITCDTKHVTHYADLMQQTWATLPKPLQQNFNHYFSKSNVPSIITAWLDKKTKKGKTLNEIPPLGCCIVQ